MHLHVPMSTNSSNKGAKKRVWPMKWKGERHMLRTSLLQPREIQNDLLIREVSCAQNFMSMVAWSGEENDHSAYFSFTQLCPFVNARLHVNEMKLNVGGVHSEQLSLLFIPSHGIPVVRALKVGLVSAHLTPEPPFCLHGKGKERNQVK
ncbi:hypothetical protein TNIN_295841 [Trichonephila inaurata madagascariensis]|uniref:Uncharacterized protein n=1 Tax=Trichonephila inaurata madagascariensis TaxID=2747483 RepID=A0A8X6Y5P3_9ARAC|nr:hypothetical protein TNIN_295841 [Trichonephila inaurata madagascariensis]